MKIGLGLVMLVVATAGLAVVGLRTASPSGASSRQGTGACGGDRWYVRTLQDRPKLLPVHPTTLAKLQKLARPSKVPTTRHPSEHQIVTLDTQAAPYLREANGDLLILLYSPSKTRPYVIASVPAPSCNSRATQYRRRQMGIARQKIVASFGGATCSHRQVTGVVFFSTKPRTQGETRNRIRLSPVLGFTRLCDQ
jgi:hypothetical protein